VGRAVSWTEVEGGGGDAGFGEVQEDVIRAGDGGRESECGGGRAGGGFSRGWRWGVGGGLELGEGGAGGGGRGVLGGVFCSPIQERMEGVYGARCLPFPSRRI